MLHISRKTKKQMLLFLMLFSGAACSSFFDPCTRQSGTGTFVGQTIPSGKFDSNKLVLELTVITYNILRIIGQESLKKRDDPTRKKVRRRRLRTVISNLMQFAGHLTEHAGKLVLAIGKSNRWRFTFKRIYDSFALAT